MRPSSTWRFLIVSLGFLFVTMNAIPATYLPGLHGPLVPGPLSILFLVNMMNGMLIMAYGLISPTVMFPEWVEKKNEE